MSNYTGTMDYWDPAVTDGFARDREAIMPTINSFIMEQNIPNAQLVSLIERNMLQMSQVLGRDRKPSRPQARDIAEAVAHNASGWACDPLATPGETVSAL